MGSFLAIAVIAGIAIGAYKTGKVTGSHGGFRAGLRRGRNSNK